MSDDRGTQKGFFSRMFNTPEGNEETIIYTPEEVGMQEPRNRQGAESGTGETRGGFTVERAAEVIKDLPPDVPWESAVRIVRGTLLAAGIDIEELGRSSRSRESKLSSEIDLSYERIDDLKDRTDEVVQGLEEQIRKAREARDYGVDEEEDRISSARSGLRDVELVRDFFGLPGEGIRRPFDPDAASYGEPTDETPPGGVPVSDASDEDTSDDTQVIQRSDVDDTEVIRRTGPLAQDPADEDTQQGGAIGEADTREDSRGYREP